MLYTKCIQGACTTVSIHTVVRNFFKVDVLKVDAQQLLLSRCIYVACNVVCIRYVLMH